MKEKRPASDEGLVPITSSSSPSEIRKWLQASMLPDDFSALDFGDVGGAELFSQDVTTLFVCKSASVLDKVALIVDDARSSAQSPNRRARVSSSTDKYVTDEMRAAKQKMLDDSRSARSARVDDVRVLHVKEEDPSSSDDEAGSEQHAAVPNLKPDVDAEMEDEPEEDADVAIDELDVGGDNEAMGGESDADDDGAGVDADEDAGEDGGGALEGDVQEDNPVIVLDACQPVELPDKGPERDAYLKRVNLGVQCFCEGVGTQGVWRLGNALGYGHGTRVARSQEGLDKATMVLGDKLSKAIQDKGDNDETLCAYVNKIKAGMHTVLSFKSIQKRGKLARLAKRVLPYTVDLVQKDVDAGDGSNAKVSKAVEVTDVQPDVLERLWQLWQRMPFLGTVTVPVQTRADKKFPGGALWLRTKLMVKSNLSKEIKCGINADQAERDRVEALLTSLTNLCECRRGATGYENGTLRLLADLAQDASEPDLPMSKVLTVHMYLEGGLTSLDAEARQSGFIQYSLDVKKGPVNILTLLQGMQHFKEDAGFVAQATTAVKERDHILECMEKRDIDPFASAEGDNFYKIVQDMADSVQEWPDDLAERLKPFMHVELHPHQLASLGYVLEEEAAGRDVPGELGLQRHIWWKLRMPAGMAEGSVVYFSPLFNVIWWAESPKELQAWDRVAHKPVAGATVRQSCGYEIDVANKAEPSRGGILALDVGLGKTVIMIAAHQLDYDPDAAPELLTEHTAAELRQYEVVQVGREDHEKDTHMFTGFKQLDNATGSIVPDGSVRFKGRGNLVVAPSSLVAQWSSEMPLMAVQPQNVIMLHKPADRKHFCSNVDGLRTLASYDWVITTPGIAAKEIDTLRAIDWRRVIADEAHQLTGSAVVSDSVKGTPAQRAAAYMRLLNTIPARAYWCLTGTPVNNTKKMESLDRPLQLLGTGVSTRHHLLNMHIAWLLCKVAIRFTSDGKIQGEQVLELPPLTEEERMVELTNGDRMVLGMCTSKLLAGANIDPVLLTELQARAANGGDIDPADEAHDKVRYKAITAFKLCGKIIDPIRKALSGGLEFFFPVGAEANEESMTVGEPADLKRPRKKAGEERMSNKEWQELRAERAAKYQQIFLSSKLDKVAADVVALLEGETEERPVKIIIYSNFLTALSMLKKRMGAVLEDVKHTTIEGSTSLEKRQLALDSFQTDAECKIFFLNKQCGAMGINLTAASHIFIMEPSWNPVWEKQAIGRAHRMGQKNKNISVIRYVGQDTLEARLRQMMTDLHDHGDGDEEDELARAALEKMQFQSEEHALNDLVSKIFRLHDLAAVIGNVMPDETSDEEEEEEDAAAAVNIKPEMEAEGDE